MAQEQVQKQKAQVKRDTHIEDSHTDVSNAELAEATEQTLDNIDDVLEDQIDNELLDEIDDVLEENAEQFVTNFVQAGGQ